MLQLRHLLAGVTQALQHLARGLQVDPPGLGQDRASGAALEQPYAQLLFQVGDRLGEGRGGFAQLLGGTAETTVLRRGDEHAEGSELVHTFFHWGKNVLRVSGVLSARVRR
ncbi:hypothetical protein D9M68_979830 [compost metagenome]